MLSHFSHVRLFATLWTMAHQAPLSMEFSRQEYWSGLPFPSPIYTYIQYTIYIHAVYYIHTYSKLCNHVSGGKELTAAE